MTVNACSATYVTMGGGIYKNVKFPLDCRRLYNMKSGLSYCVKNDLTELSLLPYCLSLHYILPSYIRFHLDYIDMKHMIYMYILLFIAEITAACRRHFCVLTHQKLRFKNEYTYRKRAFYDSSIVDIIWIVKCFLWVVRRYMAVSNKPEKPLVMQNKTKNCNVSDLHPLFNKSKHLNFSVFFKQIHLSR